MLGELVPEHYFHLHRGRVVSSGTLDEKMCENTNIEELLLFPVNRLLVRELFCCLPELGDGWLVTKVVTDLRPFCELNIPREANCVMIQGPRGGHTLK